MEIFYFIAISLQIGYNSCILKQERCVFDMEQHEILLKLRKEHKLTLEELSKKTGISRNMLWHLEKGNRKGTIDTLQKLSSFYNVSLDYITNNSERVALIDDFIKNLVDEGYLKDSENIPPEIEKQILDLIKLKIKNLT